MRSFIAAFALSTVLLAPITALAQSKNGCPCNGCPSKGSLNACVQCNMSAGPWTKDQSVNWCKRCMKACR